MSAFYRAVWRACGRIPKGQVRTYGWIARKIGRPRAARAVGRALAANPFAPVIPCHRVVGADGSLTGYSGPGGIQAKRRLLKKEGWKGAFILAVVFRVLFCADFSPAEEGPRPDWWDSVEVLMERKSGSAIQYEHIFNALLAPAYQASGQTRELLLKKSIKAFTQLIEWFPEKKHRAVALGSQYQIAKAYQELGDVEMARRAFQKCLLYGPYIVDPPVTKSQAEISATVRQAQRDLEALG
ncbi:MAG: MGMT family protein [Candidatus Omnitrophica bacterium]|nr:MGMT family protein [Candidatus Omnitrophota bacterium]